MEVDTSALTITAKPEIENYDFYLYAYPDNNAQSSDLQGWVMTSMWIVLLDFVASTQTQVDYELDGHISSNTIRFNEFVCTDSLGNPRTPTYTFTT